jgi:hypothetical protein
MKMLKTILFLLVTVLALNLKAQDPTVSEKLTEVNDKVNGLLERVATDKADLQKLTKIKVSSYIPVGATLGSANYQNKFAGSYLYLIKNLGKRNQLAFRYDYYDPNTDITGSHVTIKQYVATTSFAKKASSKSELATTTLGFAFHHYFDDNIRISLNYDVVENEKVGQTTGVGNI